MKEIKFISGTDEGSKFALFDNTDPILIGLRPVLMFKVENDLFGFMFGYRLRLQPKRNYTIEEMVEHFYKNYQKKDLKISKKHASYSQFYQNVSTVNDTENILKLSKKEFNKLTEEFISEYNNSDNPFEEKRFRDYFNKSINDSMKAIIAFLGQQKEYDSEISFEVKNGIIFDSNKKEVYKYIPSDDSDKKSGEPTKIN